MIPSDWANILEALYHEVPFPSEEGYLSSVQSILVRTVPTIRMSVPPQMNAIAWYLFKSFYIARTKYHDLQGRVNLVIHDAGTAAAFVHLLSAYLELAERSISGSAAATLSANERASWGTDFSPPAVNQSYVVLWDADDVPADYKVLAGLASALERVDDAKQGTIVISRTPINPRKTLKSKNGEAMELSRLKLQRLDVYETVRAARE